MFMLLSYGGNLGFLLLFVAVGLESRFCWPVRETGLEAREAVCRHSCVFPLNNAKYLRKFYSINSLYFVIVL